MVDKLHIGVLALQGAFREHRLALEACGAQVTEIRRPLAAAPLAGLERFDGLVLPGGESTAMGRLMVDEGLLEPVRACARTGMPVYGSCAGLILLSRGVEGPDGEPWFVARDVCAAARARSSGCRGSAQRLRQTDGQLRDSAGCPGRGT